MIDSLTFFNFAKFSSPLVLYLVLMVILRIALYKVPLFKQQYIQSVVGIGKGILHVIIICVCLIATLGIFGINVQGVFQGVGLLSLAIGLIFKDLGSKIITSISFLFYKPFAVGDKIRIEDAEGKVVKIDIRYTILDTKEELNMIPNFLLSNTKITIIK